MLLFHRPISLPRLARSAALVSSLLLATWCAGSGAAQPTAWSVGPKNLSPQQGDTLPTLPVVEDLDALMCSLLETIEQLSTYQASDAPPLFVLPQAALEAKICEQPCSVSAAYLPRVGIYLAEHLDPLRNPADRAALLHELVHHLQQGHPRFARMAPCARERAKEEEAYALQNAYLALIGSAQRVTFFDGDFECVDDASVLDR